MGRLWWEIDSTFSLEVIRRLNGRDSSLWKESGSPQDEAFLEENLGHICHVLLRYVIQFFFLLPQKRSEVTVKIAICHFRVQLRPYFCMFSCLFWSPLPAWHTWWCVDSGRSQNYEGTNHQKCVAPTLDPDQGRGCWGIQPAVWRGWPKVFCGVVGGCFRSCYSPAGFSWLYKI